MANCPTANAYDMSVVQKEDDDDDEKIKQIYNSSIYLKKFSIQR